MSLVKSNVVFPALLNEILKPDWFGGLETVAHNLPPVNIKESDADFELELSVPGRVKEDFKIEIDKAVLTVSAKTEDEKTEKSPKYTRREFTARTFKRSFNLPDSIDVDAIKAAYENGILSFRLPKKAEALPKPKREIALS